MKFLILNTSYSAYLKRLYAERPGLAEAPYAEQLRARNDSLFGMADFYSSALRSLGHEAHDIHVNNGWMQRAWALEQGLRLGREQRRRFRLRGGLLPWISREWRPRFLEKVLAAQIRHCRPDVLLNQAMDGVDPRFLRELKPEVRLLVGQCAAPLDEGADFGCYDLFLSSLPHFVERFRRLGIPSEFVALAFEPRVREAVPLPQERDIPVSFVGSLFGFHRERIRLLEYLCDRSPVQIWGQGVANLRLLSPIRRRYQGPAFGREMYQILARSKIALNHHIGAAGPYANNLRLYEATGMGALLLTDWKENLPRLFAPEREAATYRTPEECGEKIAHYLAREEERAAVARAGEERTLREHTYAQRAAETAKIIERRLSRKAGG
ncbi:MAG: glycosyltransferase [Planctomycetota bacterium]